MKKLLLTAVLVFAALGTFADDFDDFVAVMQRNSASQGWVVRSDKAKRLVFFDVKIPASGEKLTQEQFDQMKPGFVKNFKDSTGEQGIAALKEFKVTLIFYFITTDGKRFRLTIAPADL